jgi:hydrogenase nickel incorporation protein HypB
LKRVPLKKKILEENDRIAGNLRDHFTRHRTLALNLIGSPGSGKTSLLEQSLARLPGDLRAAVLTGDIATERDAERLRRFGAATQITTGGACHLDATMVKRGLEAIPSEQLDVLFVENVGNLVCPAGFDLGEDAKVVILSVTEGDDKPLKYPNIFVRSALMILNKIDLLPHVQFDVEKACENARKVHPSIELIQTSCTTGEGVDDWLSWLRGRLQALHSQATVR